KPLTDGDPTFDPRLQGASEHSASPRCEHSHMGGGDDSTGQRSRCLGPACKRWHLWDTKGSLPMGQRREIEAWRRSRKGKCALPQRVSVREPNRICKPLFLNANGASPKFWCNI